MANNCYNGISITEISDVNREKLNTFFKKVLVNINYGTGMVSWFLVAKQFPHREEFTEIDLASEDAFYKDPKLNTYDIFGSKWFECCWDRDCDSISGDSAWSPIDPFIKIISEEFNFQFEMNYEEGGCEIYGTISKSNDVWTEIEMTKWEFYYKENDIWAELEYYIDEGYLDSSDLDELESLMNKDEYKELCDMISSAEQEDIKNGKERDEWLFINPKN